jgi:hypothetical protein
MPTIQLMDVRSQYSADLVTRSKGSAEIQCVIDTTGEIPREGREIYVFPLTLLILDVRSQYSADLVTRLKGSAEVQRVEIPPRAISREGREIYVFPLTLLIMDDPLLISLFLAGLHRRTKVDPYFSSWSF